MSLFNMFSRPKVEKMHGYAEPDLPIVHEPSPPPQPTERLRQQIATKSDAVSRTVPLYHTPRPDIVPVCLRPPSRHQPPSSNRSSRSQRQAPYSAPTRLRDWDPPPLFQAYPQSTKHAMLQASNLSADMILRGHGHTTRKQHSLIQGMMGSMVDVSRVVTEGTDVWRVERNQRRLSSQSVRSIESTLHVEVVEKIYCLVTSGFVLQYNSDGPSDRLPEKVLQLGTDSAAFASDLVPGKPFVLQISQTADIEGTKSVNLQSSLLSRLVHRNAAARRMTSSFLLILESAEELDSWMIAVRQEIEALGGKRVRPELSARQKADELARTEKTLRERPSHRYLVRRDPSRISVIAAFKDTPVPSPEMSTLDWDKSPNSVEGNQGDASSSASTYSSRYSSIRGSADTTATTVTSSDQQHISHSAMAHEHHTLPPPVLGRRNPLGVRRPSPHLLQTDSARRNTIQSGTRPA
ncbi:hypothetical protein LTR04_001095 [Oleoguttula sp. CCFEE 6159]|nr:hypothetical protein LTR04_001095 [Oleoguttula sp. CCFEE 6159]